MNVPDAKCQKELKAERGRLKRLLAGVMPKSEMTKVAMRKKL
jgi:hypothetical protein